MKIILVPADFSEFTTYAGRVAASIAKKNGAKLHFLHAIDLPITVQEMSREEYDEYIDNLEVTKAAQKHFEALMEEPYLKGITVSHGIQYGKPVSQIITAADGMQADLIVMGSHGVSGFKDRVLGTTTKRVVRNSAVPVLTVKQNHVDFEVKAMVFASNFFGEVNRSFEHIKKFASHFGAKIHLLKVITPDNFEESEYSENVQQNFADEFKLENYSLNTINADTEEKGILQFAKNMSVELISLETHGKKGIEHLLSGSIAEDLASHAKLPVLSVRIEKEPVEYGVLFPGD